LPNDEKRALTGGTDPVQNLAEHILGFARDEKLILIETALSVDPIPVQDAIERIEEGRVVGDARDPVASLQVEDRLVEEFYRR